ncbi:MAG: hypothetical protein V1921_05940 [Candidatus Altiarchaeota archaeon]
MTEETEALFNGLFALEDIRELLRETAPGHKLNVEQKTRLEKALKKARKALDNLEAKL